MQDERINNINYMNSNINNWAMKILRNITRGYIVAYATARASDCAMLFANARHSV
jgi:hypothetical protein